MEKPPFVGPGSSSCLSEMTDEQLTTLKTLLVALSSLVESLLLSKDLFPHTDTDFSGF